MAAVLKPSALARRWFVLAHWSLFAAFAAVALAPASIGGFYYHPKMLAVVHLVTLGWITASILGALYLVVPMALGGRLEPRRSDVWLFWTYAVGVSGMASHFWIDEPLGMVGAAAMAGVAALWIAARAARAIAAARRPAVVALPFQLAFVNLLLAAGLGVAVGLDKLLPVLPGASLDHVVAHAHLAAIGWATMMVLAAGTRLLPMLLPAAAPTGPWVWAGVLATEAGVLGLAGCLFAGRGPLGAFALLTVAGLGIFLARIAWMLRHQRPPPARLPRPELAKGHIAAALCWLLVAAALGLAVVFAPRAPWRLDAILAYGAAGLVGFLAQIVVGVAGRLLPLRVWMDELGGEPPAAGRPSPYELADRRLAALILGLWTAGVPLLVAGLGLGHELALRAAGGLLAAAALAGLAQQRTVRRAALRAPGRRGSLAS